MLVSVLYFLIIFKPFCKRFWYCNELENNRMNPVTISQFQLLWPISWTMFLGEDNFGKRNAVHSGHASYLNTIPTFTW